MDWNERKQCFVFILTVLIDLNYITSNHQRHQKNKMKENRICRNSKTDLL